jgi:PAS domain S-box-containing protein
MNDLTNGASAGAYRALLDSEELYRTTLANISDAVFLTDDDGVYTFICPNVDVIFGYVPDEVQAMRRIGGLLGENLFDRADLDARGEILVPSPRRAGAPARSSTGSGRSRASVRWIASRST